MRHTVRHRRWPYQLALVVALLMILGGPARQAWNVPAAGAAEFLILTAMTVMQGLILITLLYLVVSRPWQTTIETDTRQRMLHVESHTASGGISKDIPFDDCCEICCVPVRVKDSAPHCRLCIVGADGQAQEIASFDRLAEGRDVAARLAAEIGCPSTDTRFPLAPPPTGQVVVFAIVGLPAVCMPLVFLMGARALPFGRLLLAVFFVVMTAVPFGLVLKKTLTQWGFTTNVRNDPAGRVLRVYRRRGLFGWDSWNYPYDDIAEIVAETVTADEPGGPAQPESAAARPAAYGVRIVARDDVARPDVPWDGVGGAGPPRDNTVFRSRDRDEARLTAERLARRIGRPWRDATA